MIIKKLGGAESRALGGAMSLDIVFNENWINRINLKILDLAMPKLCILGQLFGDYATAISQLKINTYTQFDCGFQAHHKIDAISLTDAWKEEIMKRKK